MRIIRECGPIPGVFRLFETGTEGAVDVRASLDRQNAGIGEAPRSDAVPGEREWQGCEAGDRRGAGEV